MDETRRFFVNKIIGKVILLFIWTGLVVGNLFCLMNMTRDEFINWVILSLSAFAFLMLVVDSLVYWVLAVAMLDKSQNVEYFTG